MAKLCAYSAEAREWEEFARLTIPVVGLAARRLGAVWGDRSTATATEIVQEVFLRLCEDERRILREFEDRGEDSILKLLRIITATVGTDHFRRLRADKRGGSVSAVSYRRHAAGNDLEDADAVRALEMLGLYAQLDGLLRLFPNKVSARDRRLFWLHFKHGMTAEAISSIPAMGLSASGVESALIRLSRLLRKTVIDGKPKLASEKNKSSPAKKIKEFSPPFAINNIKQR